MATHTIHTVAATESFIGNDGHTDNRMIRAGDVLRSDDPAVKKWPDKFLAVDRLNGSTVEQATAAPGERRG